jgi:hypothetical protein
VRAIEMLLISLGDGSPELTTWRARWRLFHRAAGVIQPTLVHEVTVPIGSGRPGQLGDGVDDGAKITLAGAQGLIRLFAILDVDVSPVPFDDSAGFVRNTPETMPVPESKKRPRKKRPRKKRPRR